MLKNDTDNFEFEDNSYEDNYGNNSFESAEGLFEGNELDIFGDGNNTLFDKPNNQFGEQPINNQGMYQQSNMKQGAQPNQQYQQQGYQQQGQQNYQQGYQQQGHQQQGYQQQGYQQNYQQQGNVMIDNFRRQVGKVVENGDVHLKNSHIAIIVFALGILGLLILTGLHSCATRPKKQPNTQLTQQVTKQTNSNYAVNKSSGQENTVDTLNLIIVDDKVPIDYTSTFIETTGLVTATQKYVIDNQVIYCLTISITVGNDTKQIRHFCNRNTFEAITTGTIVNVKYQQVDEHNISVYEITQ